MFARTLGQLRPNFCSILLLVCFSAATLAAAPRLRLSNTAVGPIYVENGANAPAQTINAFNAGDSSLNLSLSSSAAWLSGSVGSQVNCPNGPAPTCNPIAITANTVGLAIGTYTETLTLTDPNAIDSPQTVTVTVQVNGAPASTDLYVTPSTGPTNSATLTVNTGGPVKSSVQTSDNGPWLSFAVTGGGSFLFYTPYQLRVTSQPGQAGDYSGTVALTGSPNAADNKTIAVNLHVTTQPILPLTPLTYNVIQGQALQTFSVPVQNLGMGTLSISGVLTSGGSFFSALPVGPGSSTLSLTIDPKTLTPGTYLGSMTLLSNAANSAVPIPVRVNVAAQSSPMIAVGGFVDNAAFASGQPVGSGSIAAVFGSQFSSTGAAYASALPLPTVLNDVQVLVNGTPAPLFYVDANQADIQLPFGLTAGQAVIQVVRAGQAGNQITANVDSIAPRLFSLPQLAASADSSPYGIVINASDGTLALPSTLGVPAHPAHRGDVITIYALGLGPVSPSITAGNGAPAAEPLARTASSVQVFFGGGFLGYATAVPDYAGLAPNYAGLYQINVTIPRDAPVGNVPVMLNLPGHASNFVEMAIAPDLQTSAR